MGLIDMLIKLWDVERERGKVKDQGTNEVFILGAGFSKAISALMPLTKELSVEVFNRYTQHTISPEVRRMIEEDFEKALTFLAQDHPWLRESENLRHKALYLELTHIIRGILHERCREAHVWGSNRPPLWLEALITYWHRNRTAVITLNYDTLELLAKPLHRRGEIPVELRKPQQNRGFAKTSPPCRGGFAIPSLISFEILDRNPKQEHFAHIIGEDVYDFSQGEAGDDCVPRFVVANFIPNQADRIRVSQSLWRKQSICEVPEEGQIVEEATR